MKNLLVGLLLISGSVVAGDLSSNRCLDNGELCVGETFFHPNSDSYVLHNLHHEFEVTAIFNDNSALLENKRELREGSAFNKIRIYPGGEASYYGTISYESLASDAGCLEDNLFCVNDKVYKRKRASYRYGSWKSHKIKGIHKKKKRIVIKSKGALYGTTPYGVTGYSGDDLVAVARGCTNEKFCVGEKVINSKGQSGKILGIFHDNRVLVNIDKQKDHSVSLTSDLMITK